MDSRSAGEGACHDVRDASCQRHVREHKMGGGCRDVDRKPKRADHQRHVQDSAADAEEARDEADPDALEDAEAYVHGVLVGGAGAVSYRPAHAVRTTPRLTMLAASQH
jgi:hypothetical protein